MWLFTLTPVALLAALCPVLVTAGSLPVANELDVLNKRVNENILSQLQAKYDNLVPRNSEACSFQSITIRRELYVILPLDSVTLTISSGSLSKSDRKAYTDAVLCLQAKGARTPASLVPGAKSRVSFILSWKCQTSASQTDVP